jgi:hypothetical protein
MINVNGGFRHWFGLQFKRVAGCIVPQSMMFGDESLPFFPRLPHHLPMSETPFFPKFSWRLARVFLFVKNAIGFAPPLWNLAIPRDLKAKPYPQTGYVLLRCSALFPHSFSLVCAAVLLGFNQSLGRLSQICRIFILRLRDSLS